MQMSTGPRDVAIGTDLGDSKELQAIATELMPAWLELFAKKNADYGAGSSFELGVKGQYSDIHRKMIKLKRALWHGEELAFEGVEEVIQDLISHLFLTQYMLRTKSAAERAYVYGDEDSSIDWLIEQVGGHHAAYNLAEELPKAFANKVRQRCLPVLKEQESVKKVVVTVDGPVLEGPSPEEVARRHANVAAWERRLNGNQDK